MPELKVETFNGRSTSIPVFMTIFETAMEAKTQVSKERLAMMIEFTSAEPKHSMETCLYQEPSAGYQRAKELLKKRYGSPIRVAYMYMNKL